MLEKTQMFKQTSTYNGVILLVKRNALLVHASAWVDFKGAMFNEKIKSQSQKATCMVWFYLWGILEMGNL